MSDTSRLEQIFPEDLQELLAIRLVKRSLGYIVGLFTFLGGVLGVFGYKEITNARKHFDEAQGKLERQQAGVAVLQDSLRTILVRLRSDVETERASFDRSLNNYQSAFASSLQQTGRVSGQFENHLATASQALGRADNALSQAEAARRDIDTMKTNLRSNYGHIASDVSNVNQHLDGLSSEVRAVSRSLAGGITMTVRGRVRSDLYGTPLQVRFSTINKGKVRGFMVSNRETGETLVPEMDLAEGQAVPKITVNGETYSLVPRVLLRNFLRPDAVSLQVYRVSSQDTHDRVAEHRD